MSPLTDEPSIETTEAGRDNLKRTSRVLRRLLKMLDAGVTSGPEYEKLVRKATRVTKQSAALLAEASVNANGSGRKGGRGG